MTLEEPPYKNYSRQKENKTGENQLYVKPFVMPYVSLQSIKLLFLVGSGELLNNVLSEKICFQPVWSVTSSIIFNYRKVLDNWICIICPLDKVICSQCGSGDQNGVQLLGIKCSTFCQCGLKERETGITGSTITTKTSTCQALSYFTNFFI